MFWLLSGCVLNGFVKLLKFRGLLFFVNILFSKVYLL